MHIAHVCARVLSALASLVRGIDLVPWVWRTQAGWVIHRTAITFGITYLHQVGMWLQHPAIAAQTAQRAVLQSVSLDLAIGSGQFWRPRFCLMILGHVPMGVCAYVGTRCGTRHAGMPKGSQKAGRSEQGS